MKRLLAAALMMAFAIAPSIAQAATVNAAPVVPTAVAESPGQTLAGAQPVGAAPGDTADYAAREAAAPQLGQFQGGSVVIFIGGGTLFVVLIIVLIVVA
jgi:hypothetical protein